MDQMLTTDIMEAMAKAMISDGKSIQCPLKKLELSKNEISDKGVASLLRTLQRGVVSAPELVFLCLNENKVGPQGADLLARLLSGSKALMHLHLRDNVIPDSGAMTIARVLRSNTTLMTLDLSLNDTISHTGAAALARMAQVNESLESLCFLDHKLNRQGLTVMRLLNTYGLDSDQQ